MLDIELVERLRTLAEALPKGGSVTFSRADLEHMTGMRPEEEAGAPAPIADLTVEELAEELGRSVSTIRGWAARIEGAYKLGREWRFPRPAVRAWLDAQSERRDVAKDDDPVDLGAWRRHVHGA